MIQIACFIAVLIFCIYGGSLYLIDYQRTSNTFALLSFSVYTGLGLSSLIWIIVSTFMYIKKSEEKVEEVRKVNENKVNEEDL